MSENCILQKRTDIGLIRDKNEDAAVVVSHPKDKDIKLLAIADGMGGKDLGDIASSYVVKNLNEWFIQAGVELLNDSIKLSEVLRQIVARLSEELIVKYGQDKMGTTLTLALINHTETVVLNIGDSRCYIYKDDKLVQVTEDDSQVWLYYKCGEVNKEDLRYFTTSNFISACIGLNTDLCHSNTLILQNDSYDALLLLTDGVTDLLTDKRIKEIIDKYKLNEILDRIIQDAVYVEQDLRIPLRLKRNFSEPFYIPSRGKDNATGAIYIKKDCIKK